MKVLPGDSGIDGAVPCADAAKAGGERRVLTVELLRAQDVAAHRSLQELDSQPVAPPAP
jgi:hypothetical protein